MKLNPVCLAVSLAASGCSSATSSAVSPRETTVSSSTQPPTTSPSLPIVIPHVGDQISIPGILNARYASSVSVKQKGRVEIDIKALALGPAFSPTVITGTPGQTLRVTVFQTDDASAGFQHNFSIDTLGINRDIPQGPGHSITVSVVLPTSGLLVFYCKYHTTESHAGAFVVG